MKPLELLPVLGSGSGVHKRAGLAYHDEVTVAQPGRYRATPRLDVAFVEEVEWLQLHQLYARGTPISFDFSHDIQSNTIRLFLDGLDVGSVTGPNRDVVFARARAHVRFLWALLMGGSDQ